MARKYGQQHWPPADAGPYGHSGSNSMNSQQLPYDPNDPVLGTDMTQGEWDQLRALMRKAEEGGKMNELLTVHKKEVKNAPMNRTYPPDDDWQECNEGHPADKNSSTNSNAGKAPPGALWPDDPAWKVPPASPPKNLQQGASSGIRDAREYHKKWQDRPYDPNDDPWIEDVEKDDKPKDKPVIQIYGNVVQKNADLAEAKAAAAAIAAIANQYCHPDEGGSAGFPKFNAQVPIPPPAKADPPVLPAAALGSEQSYNEQKGKGKGFEKGGKGEFGKGGQSDKGKGKEFEKGAKGEKGKEGKGKESQFPKATSHSTKCARISEEPPDVVEPNSNKMPDGAMTDGSKRRHEAVMSASDSEDGIGSYSFISDTGDSPPLFPSFPTGLPGTHKWADNWQDADVNYEEVDFSVPKPAWIKDTYHWSCTLLKMGKFAASPITYHAFVVKVFNKSADECRYAKKMIGQFRKKLTSTPRTQGPDFCAFLMHCRVDAFLNAGYVYQREFEWR